MAKTSDFEQKIGKNEKIAVFSGKRVLSSENLDKISMKQPDFSGFYGRENEGEAKNKSAALNTALNCGKTADSEENKKELLVLLNKQREKLKEFSAENRRLVQANMRLQTAVLKYEKMGLAIELEKRKTEGVTCEACKELQTEVNDLLLLAVLGIFGAF